MTALVKATETTLSCPVSKETRDRIITLLMSGEFPVDAEIARICDVPTRVVTDMLKNDPELTELRLQAQHEVAQLVEKAAVELAISGRNEMAKQKSQEFLLRKLAPEKYGDNVEQSSVRDTMKRIVLMPALPIVAVDENGIPINASSTEVIDV